MARADVGDDVYGEDPTVNRLEELAAETFDKPAGLFLASGTMGNQCSIAAQTRPGDEILLETSAHIFLYEGGALARIPQVQARTLTGVKGMLSVEEAEAAVRPDDLHDPRTALLSLEQTHLMSGGRVLPLGAIERMRQAMSRRGVKMHCDGARIFNACVAAGVKPAAYAKCFDSLTFCLSKGLSCPVGSVIVGDTDFIGECRRVRKWMGGAWRQAGYLAACGVIGLTKMVDRLAEDHDNARRLAEGLTEVPGLDVDPREVETNVVMVKTATPALEWEKALAARGVLALALGPRLLRFVTHRHIGPADVARAVREARAAVKSP
jgi:threonine aldolase